MSEEYQKHVDDGLSSCNRGNASAKGASYCSAYAEMAICDEKYVARTSTSWKYFPAHYQIETSHLGLPKREGDKARSFGARSPLTVHVISPRLVPRQRCLNAFFNHRTGVELCDYRDSATRTYFLKSCILYTMLDREAMMDLYNLVESTSFAIFHTSRAMLGKGFLSD